ADEQSGPERCGKTRRTYRLWWDRKGGPRLALIRCDCEFITRARKRRDATGAIRQAGRNLSNSRVRTSGADRELEPDRSMVQLGRVAPARATWSHNVRPDDRRVLDIHRQSRHRSGHV